MSIAFILFCEIQVANVPITKGRRPNGTSFNSLQLAMCQEQQDTQSYLNHASWCVCVK